MRPAPALKTVGERRDAAALHSARIQRAIDKTSRKFSRPWLH